MNRLTPLQPDQTAAIGPEAGESGSGLEIIDTGLDSLLAQRGIVPVSRITLDDSGLAIYEISRTLTEGSLDKALENGLITRDEAFMVALDALRVVDEIRKKGLDAHGNISPRNILLDQVHQTGAIGGFHTSKAGKKALEAMGLEVSHIDDHGLQDYVDTAFTAPEVVIGKTPDAGSDVYEGAQTLLYALSGGRARPTVKYFDDVIGNDFEPASPPDLSTGFPTNTPDATRFAIQQALSPDPAERQSMRQLVEEISSDIYPLPSAEAPAVIIAR